MNEKSAPSIPNLVDPRTYADHHMPAIWDLLRSEDPVHWHPESSYGPGFWVLSRHLEISQALRDDKLFTSEKGNVLATLLRGRDPGGGRMLAVSDGNYHTELRRLLIRAFSPHALEGVARRIRRSARRLATNAIERGDCDFAQDIASIVPLETICDLLDIPVDDRPYVLRLTKSALSLDYKSHYADGAAAARRDILVYFQDLVTERRKCPGSDPISLMIDADITGHLLDDMDVILNCYSLIMGGDETSRLAMIGAVKALIENPEQWAALKSGRVSLDTAVEEVLRWTTPTMHFGRTAVADTQILDKHIRSHDIVTTWLVSGNHDQAVFKDAGKFDLARSPNKHLSLGYGRHFCLGAYLGRVEISAMLDALRTFTLKIDQCGPERHIYSNFLSGMSSLPVSLVGDMRAASSWEE